MCEQELTPRENHSMKVGAYLAACTFLSAIKHRGLEKTLEDMRKSAGGWITYAEDKEHSEAMFSSLLDAFDEIDKLGGDHYEGPL